MQSSFDPEDDPDVEATEEVDHAVFPVAVLGPPSLVDALCPGPDGIVVLLESTAATLRQATDLEDLGEPRPHAVVVAVGATDLDAGLHKVMEILAQEVHVVAAVKGLSRSQGVDLPGLVEHLGVPLVDMDAPHGCDRLRTELLLSLRSLDHPRATAPRTEAARRALVRAALAHHTSGRSTTPWILVFGLVVLVVAALAWLGALG